MLFTVYLVEITSLSIHPMNCTQAILSSDGLLNAYDKAAVVYTILIDLIETTRVC